MKIYFATMNESKLNEARQVLEPIGYQVLGLEVNYIEPDEGTVQEIAMQKLEQVLQVHPELQRVMVDDAGIFFQAYPLFPGVLAKRVFQRIGYHGIEKLLAGEDRSARFEGAIALYSHGQKKIFSGMTKGTIVEGIPTTDSLTNVGFPYDPLFVPDGGNQVLADMDIEQRLSFSYRRKMLDKMALWMKENVRD
ncbi:non-canonical purine NTP pyrophosphatase [Baia soyae]|uniref:DITPase n=1 Tax=Baia soyae TaxID=1544746 RepID=A0A4R2S2M8_9BACL|nr:non-canonical purine NTP pyrophosphatase [Baia soyae]TCP69603.1 dITPase [Baia soyae]